MEKREKETAQAAKPKELSDAERDAALELLRDPNLLERILADFERCGVVGERHEQTRRLPGGDQRKLEEPLAVLIQTRARRASPR